MKKESLEGKTAQEIRDSIPVGHTIAVSQDFKLYASDENMGVAMQKLRLQGYNGDITLFTHYDPKKMWATVVSKPKRRLSAAA